MKTCRRLFLPPLVMLVALPAEAASDADPHAASERIFANYFLDAQVPGMVYGIIAADPWDDRQTRLPEAQFSGLLRDGVPFTLPAMHLPRDRAAAGGARDIARLKAEGVARDTDSPPVAPGGR